MDMSWILSRVFFLIVLSLVVLPPASAQQGPQDIIAYQNDIREDLTQQIDKTKADIQKILEEINKTREEIEKQKALIEAQKALVNQTKAEIEKQKALIEAQEQLRIQLEEQRQRELELQLQKSIEQQREDVNKTMVDLKIRQGEIYESYLKMKIAASSLLVARQSLSELPEDFSAAASEINLSIDQTFESEQNIAQRGLLIRFVLGGDQQSAEDIENTVTRNLERLTAIENTIKGIKYSDSIRSLLENQMATLKKEQERLLSLAKSEKKNRGVIGLIWQ